MTPLKAIGVLLVMFGVLLSSFLMMLPPAEDDEVNRWCGGDNRRDRKDHKEGEDSYYK